MHISMPEHIETAIREEIARRYKRAARTIRIEISKKRSNFDIEGSAFAESDLEDSSEQIPGGRQFLCLFKYSKDRTMKMQLETRADLYD